MSNVLDIQISNFRDSLKLAQQAVFTGLVLAGIVQYLGHVGAGGTLPTVPFLNVEFQTIEPLQITLMALYIGAGITALFGANRAEQILRDIDDLKLVAVLSRTPCLIVSGGWFQAVLWGCLGGSGYFLAMEIIATGSLKAFFLGNLITTPFFLAFRIGRSIHDREDRS